MCLGMHHIKSDIFPKVVSLVFMSEKYKRNFQSNKIRHHVTIVFEMKINYFIFCCNPDCRLFSLWADYQSLPIAAQWPSPCVPDMRWQTPPCIMWDFPYMDVELFPTQGDCHKTMWHYEKVVCHWFNASAESGRTRLISRFSLCG